MDEDDNGKFRLGRFNKFLEVRLLLFLWFIFRAICIYFDYELYFRVMVVIIAMLFFLVFESHIIICLLYTAYYHDYVHRDQRTHTDRVRTLVLMLANEYI